MAALFGGSGGSSTTQNVNQTSRESTRYTPEYEAYVNQILGRASEASRTPFKPYDINQMFAGFTPDQQQAFNQIRGNQGAYQGYFDQGRGALDRAGQLDVMGSAQPALTEAGNAARPWEAGSGAIGASMQGWNNPNVQASYMNPYIEGAINRSQDLTARNFSEKLMPQLSSQFAKGMGQLGRSNYQTAVGRLGRDVGSEMSGNALSMMNQGYWTGAQNFQSDQNRMLQAGTAAGNLAAQNMGALGNLATTNANITSGAVNTGVGLANAYSQQAGALSNLNLMNTNALLQAGNQQQQQAQLPLTAQYQQFQQEQKWPFEMINFMNAAQRGLQIPTTTEGQRTTTTTGTGSQSGSPSVMGSILGTLSSANSIFGQGNTGGLERGYDALFGSSIPSPTSQGINVGGVGAPGGPFNPTPQARGGLIRRYAMGGPVFGPIVEPRGVLSRRQRTTQRPIQKAVGGDVPVSRGLMSRSRGAPGMDQQGGLGALPPMVAPGGGPFARNGGLPMAPAPNIPALPRPPAPDGALSMVR